MRRCPVPATRPHPALRRRARLIALASASILAGATVLAPAAADAALIGPPSACHAVAPGGRSGWCPLTPGKASGNVRAFGEVSLDSSASVLAVRTVDASTGTPPATTFACIVPLADAPADVRLQETQCRRQGGLWFAVDGGSLTVDLSLVPALGGTTFTVQVATGPSAHDANGDAFYANFHVSTVASVPPGGGGSLF